MAHSKFEITDIGNSIIKLRITDGTGLEAPDAIAMHSAMLELSNHNMFCVLLIADTQFTITSEAREIIGSEEFSSMRIADAFVTNSLANKLTGNFFIKFNRPLSPTKLFTKEPEALEWLNENIVAYNNSNKGNKSPISK